VPARYKRPLLDLAPDILRAIDEELQERIEELRAEIDDLDAQIKIVRGKAARWLELEWEIGRLKRRGASAEEIERVRKEMEALMIGGKKPGDALSELIEQRKQVAKELVKLDALEEDLRMVIDEAEEVL